MAEELRTAPVLPLTVELFTLWLLLVAEGLSVLFIVPCFTVEPELVLAERVVVVPLEGFTAELRVAPLFCLTDVFLVLLPSLTVADFLSAPFLCVTPEVLLCEVEDRTAERVPTLF